MVVIPVGSKTINCSDAVLMKLFLDALKENPKPLSMSKSMYRTCLAILMLEKLGNKVPLQKEIDVVELIIKRYSRRKSIKGAFNNACLPTATEGNDT